MKMNFHNYNRSFTSKVSLLSHRTIDTVPTHPINTAISTRRRHSSLNLSTNTRKPRKKLINFDNLPSGSTFGTLYPGDIFASQGVSFTSGRISDDINVGDKFTFQNNDQQIRLYGGSLSTSAPNVVGASVVNRADDLLMKFAKPITSLQLNTDAATSEIADFVRLLALKPIGKPSEFRVVAVVQSLDNATQSPGNRMAIDRGKKSFSYALFQTTTEAEGFDDLRFR